MIHYDYFQSRQEWLEGRKRGIGGSAAGAILGVNPYESAWQYWARLKGRLPKKEENVAMDMGHRLEPIVVDLFREATGATIDPQTEGDFNVTNDDWPHLVGSPDRIGEQDGNRFVLECKTTGQTIDPDDLPKSWFCQLQFYMLLTDINRGAIAWLSRGRDFCFRWFDRDDDFCAWMGSTLEIWWQTHIIGDSEPDVKGMDVDIAYPVSTEATVEMSTEAYNAIMRIKELKAQAKGLETEAEELIRFVKGFMKDNAIAVFKGEKVATWKSSKPREMLDTKALKAAYPDIYAAFVTHSALSRPFLLK